MLGGWPSRGRRVAYFAAFALFTAFTLGFLLNSEPYDFAKRFATSDARVLGVTGVQSSARISVLKGFRYAFGDKTGEAHFTFSVKGEQGTFDVFVGLKKRDGAWTVVDSRATSDRGIETSIVGAGS